jgi:flagellar biosynthesis/type III secretory pathway chaperone
MEVEKVPLRALSNVLWRERELLDQLLLKLEVEQLLLVNGRTKRLPLATREVEQVLESIRGAELARTIEVEQAASLLNLPGGTSLLDLAHASPAPWDAILLEHRREFIRLTAEVSELAQSNRDLLATSYRATQETLLGLRDSVTTYDPNGLTTAEPALARLLDQTS